MGAHLRAGQSKRAANSLVSVEPRGALTWMTPFTLPTKVLPSSFTATAICSNRGVDFRAAIAGSWGGWDESTYKGCSSGNFCHFSVATMAEEGKDFDGPGGDDAGDDGVKRVGGTTAPSVVAVIVSKAACWANARF